MLTTLLAGAAIYLSFYEIFHVQICLSNPLCYEDVDQKEQQQVRLAWKPTKIGGDTASDTETFPLIKYVVV
jgi:hypothetical protein